MSQSSQKNVLPNTFYFFFCGKIKSKFEERIQCILKNDVKIKFTTKSIHFLLLIFSVILLIKINRNYFRIFTFIFSTVFIPRRESAKAVSRMGSIWVSYILSVGSMKGTRKADIPRGNENAKMFYCVDGWMDGWMDGDLLPP